MFIRLCFLEVQDWSRELRVVVKLIDVATHAGVAIGTVSHVLNHPERVSPGVREQVQKSIEELGYVRNFNASSLRSGTKRIVAMVVVDIGDPFFSSVAAHVEAALADLDLVFTLSSTRTKKRRERDISKAMAAQGPRGVILTPTSLDMGSAESLRGSGIPLVLFDYPYPSPTLSSVSADDVSGSDEAVTLLLDLGHRHLGFVNGPEWATQTAQRLKGFRQAIERHPARDDITFAYVNAKEWTPAEGRAKAEEVMSSEGASPTALFCGNDMLALGAMSHLTQAGYSIPGDVSVVGFDDLAISSELPIPLTTVHRSTELLAEATVDILLDDDQPQHRVIPTYLVIRDSAGPPPELTGSDAAVTPQKGKAEE